MDFKTLVDLIQATGTWMVFFYLYVKERDAHQRSIDAHLQDLRDVILRHDG